VTNRYDIEREAIIYTAEYTSICIWCYIVDNGSKITVYMI